MKRELEINGNVYILVANRLVSDMISSKVKITGEDSYSFDMPSTQESFYALLKTHQPEMTQIEANELLEKADEEYGVSQMTEAITSLMSTVFTHDSKESPKKTISWLKEVKEMTEEKTEKDNK